MAVFNLGVILVRWNHAPRDPVARPRSWYQGYYCDASKPGIAHYWFEQTHGRLPFVGQAFDWFDLGVSLSDIQLPNNKTIDRSRVAALAMLQAAERKMPLAGRDGVVVVTDIVLPPGFVMDSGFAAVDVRSGGVPLPSNVAVLPSGSEFHYAAHEVGHVLGLDHSFGFPQIISNGVPGEYGHFWCIMSAKTYGHAIPVVDTGTDIAEPELRKKGPGLNSGTRVGRGWANPNIVELSPGTNQTLALRSLGSLGEGANVIYVKTSSGETFSIELRTPADNYDKGVLRPMVVINAVKKSLADETYPGYHCASYWAKFSGSTVPYSEGRVSR